MWKFYRGVASYKDAKQDMLSPTLYGLTNPYTATRVCCSDLFMAGYLGHYKEPRDDGALFVPEYLFLLMPMSDFNPDNECNDECND